MKGLKRSHRCTEVSSENIGETVTLMGWVQKRRNLGSLIFVDLRDRSGLIQLYFEEENKRANKYSLLFNLINFSSLIIMSLITKEQIKIVGISVICMSVFVVIMMFRIVEKTKFKINIYRAK